MKILIAEDDENMSRILKIYLLKEGWLVDCVSDGEAAVAYFETNHADLVIMDWMMPKKDGITACREIRLMKIPVKIIMLTAKTTTDNELQGLLTGADDYIRKPFDMAILILRIKKLCSAASALHFKNLSLNPDNHEVTLGNEKLDLTKKEYDLLKYFLANQNRVLSRDQILDQVWGLDYDGDSRTVDTHIRRLRKKIGDSCIRTSFGTGYIMEDRHE